MPSFVESQLVFHFPAAWLIIKADAHRFYRYLSGSGLKGVDFIGFPNPKTLVLIEVKNYVDRFPADGQLPITAILNDPSHYAAQFLQKFADSFRLIHIAHQHYQRRWWFRAWQSVSSWLPQSWVGHYDAYFWPKADAILQHTPQSVELWLWLELGDQVSSEQRDALEQQLQKYFDESPYRVQIKSRAKAAPKAAVLVRPLKGS
ncbi:MAG: hypothetical protein AAGD05_03765 [Bacteroidota bacterium]